jgi:hypothetical protein
MICVGAMKGLTFGTPVVSTVFPLNQTLISRISDHRRRPQSLPARGTHKASLIRGTYKLNAHLELVRIQILNPANSPREIPRYIANYLSQSSY